MIIDGREIQLDKGETILHAALRSGIFIPHYCYHPALSAPANCRMCLVEVEGQGKLVASCATPAMDKMVIHTDSDKVKENQRGVMEFLLLNHPLDCPVCDKAGECDLQDFSYRYGWAGNRNDIGKTVQPKKDLGGDILLYTQRCIQCTRCIRFLDEISGTSELYMEHRGSRAEISAPPGQAVDNPLAGNVVDICPVGALKSKEFLFKCRVWNLRSHDGICTRCSVGCNIRVDETEGTIQRIRPRSNPEVNGDFICDLGRHGFDHVGCANRLGEPLVRGEGGELAPATWERALEEAKGRLEKAAGVACLVSPFATNEEAWLAAELAASGGLGGAALALLPKEDREGDLTFPGGFRISKDTAPNGRGVRDVLEARVGGGRGGRLRDAGEILEEARAGKIRGLLLVTGNPHPERDRVPLEALEGVETVVVGILAGPLSGGGGGGAGVVLPGRAPFEKDGSMTNDAGRVQRVRAMLPAPGSAREDWRILGELCHALGGPAPPGGAGEITERIAGAVPGYEGLTLEAIGKDGRPKGSGAPAPETVGAREDES